MDRKKAEQDIEKGKIGPLYLCYGTETHLMEKFLARLIDRTIEPEHRDFAVSRFDLNETPVEAVLEDAETLPFMVPKKLVIASNADFFTGRKEKGKAEHDLDRLSAYLQAPADYTVMVFTVQAEKLDERKKIVKHLKKENRIVPFLPMKASELNRWISDQATRMGCRIIGEAAELLVMRCGTRLQTLASELEKLSLYAGKGGTITTEMVHLLTARSMEQDVFMLIDEIVRLRIDRALSLFHELLKQREEPVKIALLIARQFRIMLQVKELERRGYSAQQAASQLGLHPYAVKIASGQARRFSEGRLCEILSQLADLDYRMKTGLVDKTAGLELFLLGLASAEARA